MQLSIYRRVSTRCAMIWPTWPTIFSSVAFLSPGSLSPAETAALKPSSTSRKDFLAFQMCETPVSCLSASAAGSGSPPRARGKLPVRCAAHKRRPGPEGGRSRRPVSGEAGEDECGLRDRSAPVRAPRHGEMKRCISYAQGRSRGRSLKSRCFSSKADSRQFRVPKARKNVLAASAASSSICSCDNSGMALQRRALK